MKKYWLKKFNEEFARELPINRNRVLLFITNLLEERSKRNIRMIQDNTKIIKAQCAEELENKLKEIYDNDYKLDYCFFDNLINKWRGK